MTKKIKKKVKKRVVSDSDNVCDVPDCGRPVYVGWSASGVRKKVCKYHIVRHDKEGDPFCLFKTFGATKLTLNVDVDRFGFPLPRDLREMTKRVETRRSEKRTEEKQRSLDRLKEWKEGNGDVKKQKKRKLSPRPDRTAVQQEIDDLVGDILSG